MLTTLEQADIIEASNTQEDDADDVYGRGNKEDGSRDSYGDSVSERRAQDSTADEERGHNLAVEGRPRDVQARGTKASQPETYADGEITLADGTDEYDTSRKENADYKEIEDALLRFGVSEVHFFNGAFVYNGVSPRGLSIPTKNGEAIFINAQSRVPAESLAHHEVLHSLLRAAFGGDIDAKADFIKSVLLQAMGVDESSDEFQNAIDYYANTYASYYTEKYKKIGRTRGYEGEALDKLVSEGLEWERNHSALEEMLCDMYGHIDSYGAKMSRYFDKLMPIITGSEFMNYAVQELSNGEATDADIEFAKGWLSLDEPQTYVNDLNRYINHWDVKDRGAALSWLMISVINRGTDYHNIMGLFTDIVDRQKPELLANYEKAMANGEYDKARELDVARDNAAAARFLASVYTGSIFSIPGFDLSNSVYYKRFDELVKNARKVIQEEINAIDSIVLSPEYDSEGFRLTNEQSEYFKDSKVRDGKGNLKTVYRAARFNQRLHPAKQNYAFFTDQAAVAFTYVWGFDEKNAYRYSEKSTTGKALNKLFEEQDRLSDELRALRYAHINSSTWSESNDPDAIRIYNRQEEIRKEIRALGYSGQKYSLDIARLKPGEDLPAAVSTLQIENGITYIGKNAFYGLEGISEAKMPDSVVKISSGAFRGCVNLESIIVPEGTEIEDAAFEGTKIISAAIKALSFEKQGESYVIDASKNSSVQLETQFSPDAAAAKVWESSNKSVAEVDETGLVTFKLPGTVTITVSAAENPEQAAGVSMDVFFADRAQALRLDANAKCAMVGETIAVTPWGENALSAELFSWTIISGGEYAVMTRPGVFNVVKGGGTVTVKAGLIGDPLNRSASISFTTEAAPNKVKLICEDSELTEIVNDFNAPDRELIYRITPVAQAESGIYKFKAAASDKNLVTVKDLKDGSFNVVLSNKNVGACTVTFTPYAKVNGKDVAQTPVTLEVYIRDYAPKTETSVTMNTYKQESMYLPVAESADNAIVPGTVEVLDCNVKGTVSPATNLKAEYKDGYLELTALDVIAKTGKYRFVFNTAKGEYTADFSLKVANAYPKLTLKQENVLKLYDASDKAVVAITAADGAKLSAVEYTGKGYDCYAEGNAAVFSRNSEALKSGKLNVSLEGYRGTIAASVTVKTIAKPALSLSVTSSNVCAGKEYSISFKIYDKNSKKNLEGCTVSCNGFTIENNGEDYVLRPVDCNAFSGKTVLNVKVSEPGWNIAPLVLKYTLNAERSVLPTVKLKATSLSMNSAYPEVTNETELVLSQSNAAVTASFSCQTVNPDKLKVQYDSSTGKVVVRFTGEGTPVPAGSYKFTGTVKCGNVALKPITLTVKVVNVEASVTAKAAGKLDVTNPDSRLVYTLTTKNLWGSYKLASAEVLNAVTGETMDDFTAETGKDGKNNTTVSLSIKEGMKYGLNGKLSTYNVKLKLKLEGTEKTLITPKLTIKPTQSTLKVKADAATLNVYQSQAENRTVVYTVRVTGPSGAKIDEVTLGSFNAVFTKNLAEAALDLAWSIAPDGKSVKVYVTLKSLSRLGAGKSLALPLVFVPEGAVDAKANAKLNLNLKVMK